MESYAIFAERYDDLMPEEWYKDLFLYVENSLAHFKVVPSSILDAACGTGRLTKYLLSLAPVTGLDGSAEMLKIAVRKNPSANFIKLDLFKKFSLEKGFDLIVCAYDSLNYARSIDALSTAFDNFSRHLNREGILLFDCNGSSSFSGKEKIVENIVERDTEKGKMLWKNTFTKDKWTAVLTFFDLSGKTIGKETHVEYYYSPEVINKLLVKNDLKLLGMFADSSLKPGNNEDKRYYFAASKA